MDQLPHIKGLPDPFLLPDGQRIDSREQWPSQRRHIEDLVLSYEYGHLPPASKVKAEETGSKADPETGAIEKQITLHVGPSGQIPVKLILTIPKGEGRHPVIVKGDLCWGRVKPDIIHEAVRRGYMFAEFDRTDIAPDKNDAPGGARPLYPDADWGTIAAWAWGFHRVNDYLLTRDDVDPKKLINTGHSRGGKAALLAGALDERVALTVPNGSGCGGSGCYRFQAPKSEDITAILKNFPYWFKSDFKQFIGHVDQLPIDQHEVEALVAPRAMLTTNSVDDLWANPQGTQQSFMAAREVFRFLGAGDKIGIHYRHGKHDQNEEDFAALFDFADHVLLGKPVFDTFDRLPYPQWPLAFDWTAPLTMKPTAVLDVWPGAAPGEREGGSGIGAEMAQPLKPGEKPIIRLTNVTKPTITVYRPAKDNDTGASVIICPGGGYSILAWDLEGQEIANWLNDIGVTGIVLKYRVPGRPDEPRGQLPLMDAQRAISLVRSKAKEWNLDPSRIGMLGFSAGGHLTAAASTHFDQRAYSATDDVDQTSCRPDFAVLVYPAYLTDRSNEHLASDIHVTSQTPPTFLVQTEDDPVHVECGVQMFLSLKKAGVPAELHAYTTGGHGYGLRPSDNPVCTWPQRCADWLLSRGLLKYDGRSDAQARSGN
jgi:acetyl esterase/lipase